MPAEFSDRWLEPWRNPARDDERSLRNLRIAIYVAWLVLILLTAALWLPSTLFPAVPLVDLGRSVPTLLQPIFTSALCFLIVVSVRRAPKVSGEQFRVVALWVCALALWMFNQHRLQPWAYQFLLLGSVIAACPPARALPLARLLTVSLYVWSAVSKLDYSFLDTHGQTLLSGLAGAVGIDNAADKPWFKPPDPSQVRWWLPLIFPVGELLVAAGLSTRRFRRFALIGSLVMHGLLLVALGPLGLGHSLGVLAWNVYFIVQNLLLFGPVRRAPEDSVTASVAGNEAASRAHTPFDRFAEGVVIAAVILPALEPFGYFDHWPGWALYASRGERVTVDVELPDGASVPVTFVKYLSDAAPLERWQRVDVSRWSLDVLNAPVYPQGRFQIGVAFAVADQLPEGSSIRVTLDGVADRWTGARSRTELQGREALIQHAKSYWLNARPTSMRR